MTKCPKCGKEFSVSGLPEGCPLVMTCACGMRVDCKKQNGKVECEWSEN